jgi:UDP-GlcNAc:undecaprenyl-phosphate/decaprenyl-phosphate GlcNAc-1-phosphate transferase
MSEPWAALALALGAAAAWLLGLVAAWIAPRKLIRLNRYRRPVPVVLGLAMVPAFLLVLIVTAAVTPARLGGLGLADLVAVGVLMVVGLVDDLYGGDPRGLRGHLGALRRLHVTTGIIKLVAGVAAAMALALVIGDQALRVIGATILIAASTNLWNALDVVPGRALKWASVVVAVVLAAGWTRPMALPVGTTLGVVLGSLPHDLRERAMLGDAGSNPLGFLCGVGLAAVLPTDGLLLAAALAVLLQAAAETVTLSRLIEAVPPLRWFDRVGRRPEPVS